MPEPTNNAANKEILIGEVISKLQHFSQLYGVQSLFIVGGYCRALYFDEIWDVNDIDVASAYHEQAIQLAGLFASEVLNTSPEVYHRSGAAAINYQSEFGTIRIEFQGYSINGYMFNEEVRNWLHDNKIPDLPLMNNIYGRDFTINAMIFSLSDGMLLDPSGLAAKDLDAGVIRSLLPAEMLVKYNPLAVLRAIRFAIAYDFHIDSEMRSAMKNSQDKLRSALSQERIMHEIVRILKIDSAAGLKMLQEFELQTFLMTAEVKEYLSLEPQNAEIQSVAT